jgi:Tol biopolymer transport system component
VIAVRRSIMLVAVATRTLLAPVLITVVGTGAAQAKAPGPNGQIAFARDDPTVCSKRECVSSFRVNPDGRHEELLLAGVGNPHWSPDGTQVAVLSDCTFEGLCSVTMVDLDTGATRDLPAPDPTVFNEEFSCIVWSPDGTMLACEGDSDTPGFTGIYTIRSSDGGGLTKVLPCAAGCAPSDFSPDGRRIVAGLLPKGQDQRELFTFKLNGTALRQITPSGTIVDLHDGVASWSPSGKQILFGAHTDADHRTAVFVVNADGTGLHQLPIPGCGGLRTDPTSIACFDPSWSPDGTKIVFARSSPNFGTTAIYTANADGTRLSQVTTATNLRSGTPDWGPHPLAG